MGQGGRWRGGWGPRGEGGLSWKCYCLFLLLHLDSKQKQAVYWPGNQMYIFISSEGYSTLVSFWVTCDVWKKAEKVFLTSHWFCLILPPTPCHCNCHCHCLASHPLSASTSQQQQTHHRAICCWWWKDVSVSIQGFPASLQPVSWGFPALEEDFHKSWQEQRTGGVCRGKNREQPPGQLAQASWKMLNLLHGPISTNQI